MSPTSFTAPGFADLSPLQTLTAVQAAQIAVEYRAALGYYVGQGGAITVNGATAGSSAARVDIALGTDLAGSVEAAIAAQTAQAALATANSTTVASGSNGVATSTFAGAGVLSVASVSGFPTSGTLMITHAGVVSVITYTNVSGATFTGCTLILSTADATHGASVSVTMATSDTVVGSNADVTNPLWMWLEVDPSGVLQRNIGTAASPSAIPTLTAARIPHYVLFVPSCASSIDTLLTTPNGNAKLIDVRWLNPGPTPTGWQYDQDTWVYVSATSFKVAGKDVRTRFPKGTKVSYNDGGVDYGVVASTAFSTDTTVTLIGTSDYTIANATLTAPRYSYVATPQSFPEWFNWSPTLTGWSSAPTASVYRWRAISRTLTLVVDQLQGNFGTSNTTGWQISLPSGITSAAEYSQGPYGIAVDNGGALADIGRLIVAPSATVMTANTKANGGWTAANGKSLSGSLTLEFV